MMLHRFKQMIWELEYVRDILNGVADKHEPVPLARCIQRLHRSEKIMRLATEGYSIMETMSSSDFLEFRDFLSPSSGFQSTQVRELEILLGLKDEERLLCAGRHYREAFIVEDEDKTSIFDDRLNEVSIKQAMYKYATSLAQELPELDIFFAAYMDVINKQCTTKSSDIQEELQMLNRLAASTDNPLDLEYIASLKLKAEASLKSTKHNPTDIRQFFCDPEYGIARRVILLLFTVPSHPHYTQHRQLFEGLLFLESAVTIWRQRHARMVEVFIGRKPGTGGTSGVDYIDNTAATYRIFRDLFQIRGMQVARSKLDFDAYHHTHKHIHKRQEDTQTQTATATESEASVKENGVST
jgi:tryptophan 2,3-dioxygenase